MRRTKIFTIAVSLLLSVSAIAQDRRVAVFDPAGDVPTFIREIVREEISNVVVNTAGYTVLERALIQQVLQEDQFQASGLVDDAQVSEIGRRMGANLAFITNIAQMTNGNFHISARLIDVETARVERQQTIQTVRRDADLTSVVTQLARQMLTETEPVVIVTLAPEDMLTASGRRVYQAGRRLSADEVRGLMANTDALRLYDAGMRRSRSGNILLWSGVGVGAVGSILSFTLLAVDNGWYFYLEDNTTRQWYSHYDYNHVLLIASVSVAAAMIISGTTLTISGRRNIRNAVNSYNNNPPVRNAELNFGITQSGNIGFALNF